MKFISVFLVFSFFAFGENYTSEQGAQPSADGAKEGSSVISEEPDINNVKKDETSTDASEEEALMQFLMEEVIPAFGGFQDLLFSNKPSFDIHWTPQGMQVKNCSFEVQLKQLRTIKYNLADMELYEFQSNAEIGDPRFLFVQISCGETNNVTDTARFNIKFFVTDENLNPSVYSLKIKTMEQEQLDIKLDSIEMDVEIETVDYVLLLDSDGHIERLPHESPFLKSFEESQAYAEVIEEDQSEESVESEQIKNMYDIPVSVWNQIKGVNETPSDESALVSVKKVTVEQVINVNGSAEIFLPVYKDGVKQDARVVIPIVGHIFSPAEGDLIPFIDISMR
ncbi:MAG: hypothetical protein OXK80_01420 [Bdellovibrionales bacterium]|nr:hypothetical protein [Bdellovibrionales bacterium]